MNALIEAEAAASQFFTADALDAPLADLHERFQNRHRGLKKLSGEYRADKKTLSGVLVTDIKFKQGRERLPDAIRWSYASRAYRAALDEHGERLGHYWRGRDTDFHAVADASASRAELLNCRPDGQLPQSWPTISAALSHRRAAISDRGNPQGPPDLAGIAGTSSRVIRPA